MSAEKRRREVALLKEQRKQEKEDSWKHAQQLEAQNSERRREQKLLGDRRQKDTEVAKELQKQQKEQKLKQLKQGLDAQRIGTQHVERQRMEARRKSVMLRTRLHVEAKQVGASRRVVFSANQVRSKRRGSTYRSRKPRGVNLRCVDKVR
jgi:hypothetical protein